MFNLPREQALFAQKAMRQGCPLALTYAGKYLYDPVLATATPAPITPATATCYGFTSLKATSSDFMKQTVQKLGETFLPDGVVLLPMTVPLDNLVSIHDTRTPGAAPLYVVIAAPDTISEGIYHMAYVRAQSPFNRTVRVVAESKNRVSKDPNILIKSFPARLTFPSIGGSTAGDLVNTEFGAIDDATPFLEIPNLYLANGSPVYFDPKHTIIQDDPALGGTPGTILGQTGGLFFSYRIVSPNLDPGGDKHHQRYLVQLMLD